MNASTILGVVMASIVEQNKIDAEIDPRIEAVAAERRPDDDRADDRPKNHERCPDTAVELSLTQRRRAVLNHHCHRYSFFNGAHAKREMLRARIAESDGRLGLVVLTADVDDDALTERRMLDVVAEPQPDQLRVRR